MVVEAAAKKSVRFVEFLSASSARSRTCCSLKPAGRLSCPHISSGGISAKRAFHCQAYFSEHLFLLIGVLAMKGIFSNLHFATES